jgi:hypothetical protein
MAQSDQSSSELRAALFRNAGDASSNAVLLEQYKIYLQLLDKISDRRQSANSFFLSINTGLCALMGYMFSKEVPAELRPLLWVIPFPGILISYFWFRLVRSYRYVNAAKFRVVEAIEERLPIAPYAAEWIALRNESKAHRYIPLTNLEVWIPRCFICLYIAILLLLVPWHALAGILQQH